MGVRPGNDSSPGTLGGSVLELQTQIAIAHRQHFIDDQCGEALDSAAAEVGRLLNGWLKKLRTKN